MTGPLARYKQLIVWGGGHNKDSLRWIMAAFHRTANKMGLTSTWIADDPGNRFLIRPGSLVIAADVWSKHIGQAIPDVDYCLHNFNSDEHELPLSVEPEHVLRLQTFTNDASGVEWEPLRRYDRDARTLFGPWGSDLLAEEFLEPVFNPASRDAVYVGAVWADQHQGVELGNEAMVNELRLVLADHALRFKHLTQVSDAENIAAVRVARLAPAFAGAWQVSRNYIPCRCFKNPAYGVLCVTNVPAVQALYAGCHVSGSSVPELVDAALSLRRSDYLAMTHEQQRIAAKYSYREALEAIGRALEEGRS